MSTAGPEPAIFNWSGPLGHFLRLGARDSATSVRTCYIARSQTFSLHCACEQCASTILMQRRKFARKAKVGGGLGRKHSTVFNMLPRTPHAEDHSYCLLQACRIASRTYGSLVTIGLPSSSTLLEEGRGDELSARRCGSARPPDTYPCLESREPDRFRLRMGTTLEKNCVHSSAMIILQTYTRTSNDWIYSHCSCVYMSVIAHECI